MRDRGELTVTASGAMDLPAELFTELAELERLLRDWLLGYTSRATRLSYADALGVSRTWVTSLTSQPDPRPASASTPPVRTGKFRHLAWFRWCDHARIHPLGVTSTEVKQWQQDLAAAGVPKSTRAHRLAVVGKFYGYLWEHGAVPGDPTNFDRSGLGLGRSHDTSATVVLTARQVELLLHTAARVRRGVNPLMALRAVALTALFTLGLRVAEATGLDRGDLHQNRGRKALRVLGKGGKFRIVYLSKLADNAVTEYLAERDRWSRTSVLSLPHQVAPHRTPLIITRDGGRMNPRDVWALLRRIAVAAGPELAEIAGALGPHVVRHFYVTSAAEGGADMTHVQADVGHASVDTTQRVYNQAARDPSRSAVDIVEATLIRARHERVDGAATASALVAAAHALTRAADTGDAVELLHHLQEIDRLCAGPVPEEVVACVREISEHPHPRIAAHARTLLERLNR
ncbi:tyrosine-type recombinase/integrase [Lentzea sp. NPDC005914]|uniref:tyrosine-type recombinase/integrase n=1 Tax=Lentzea sp. NPDC005914 TaxID=3154572 RepID=UPI0033FC44FC